MQILKTILLELTSYLTFLVLTIYIGLNGFYLWLKNKYINFKKWVIGNWKKLFGVIIGGMILGGGAVMFPRDEPPASGSGSTTYKYNCSSSDSDGHLIGQDLTNDYGAARNKSTADSAFNTATYLIVGQRYSPAGSGRYYVYRTYLYFDTSNLSSSHSIQSASLFLKCYIDASTKDYEIIIQRNETEAKPAGMPVVTADYNLTYWSGDGGNWNSNNYDDENYIEIPLNASGLSWINKGGWTNFTLRSNNDTRWGHTPTSNEYIYFYSHDKGTGFEPYLNITWLPFEVSDVTPVNNSVDVDVVPAPVCSVTIDGGLGETVDVYWYNSTDGSSWAFQQKNATVYITTPATVKWTYDEAFLVDTKYYWKVAINDGSTNLSYVYDFTTIDDVAFTHIREGKMQTCGWAGTCTAIYDNDLNTYEYTDRNSTIEYTSMGYTNPFQDFPNKEIKNVAINFSANYSTHTENITVRANYAEGTSYGNNHTFLIDSTSTKYYEFDITKDTNAPSYWTYYDIEKMGYKLVSAIKDGGTVELAEISIKIYHEHDSSPFVTNVIPFDGEKNVSTSLSQVSIDINSTRGNFNYTLQGSFLTNTGANNQGDGTYTANIISLSDNTDYTWYVNVSDYDDSTNYTQNYIIYFDTDDVVNYDLLIITSSENYTIAKNFSDWKEANTDFICSVVNITGFSSNNSYYINGTWGDNNPPNTFYARQAISDYDDYNNTNNIIRNYVRGQFKNYNISYVILFGARIPYKIFNIYESTFTTYSTRPTDTLFYGMLNGTQNRYDWSGAYGWLDSGAGNAPEGLNQYVMDLIPARFPAYTSQELWYMINKTKNYFAINVDDIYCKTYILYNENMTQYNGIYNDSDDAWTNTTWGLSNSYLNSMEDSLTFVNGTGIAPGQVGEFDNCITQEQVNTSLYDIFNCTNATHPNSAIIYHYSAHSNYGYPASSVDDISGLTNNTYPFIQPPFACRQGEWTAGGKGSLSVEIMRQEGGSVVVMASTSYGLFTEANSPYLYFFNSLLTNGTDGTQTLGEVWEGHYNNQGNADVLKFLQYHGDPTLYYKGYVAPSINWVYPEDNIFNYYEGYTGIAKVNISTPGSVNVYWYENQSGVWNKFGENLSVSPINNYVNLSQTNSNFTSAGIHHWSINASSGAQWTNASYKFTIWNGHEYPTNGSGVAVQPTCNLTVYGNSSLTVTFASNYSGSWANYQTNTSVSSGSSVSWSFTGADTEGITYYWKVYRNDTTGNNVSETYHFTVCYSTTVRLDGIDYFVWLGTNTSAWHIYQIINSLGFDEGIEYIAVWRNQ